MTANLPEKDLGCHRTGFEKTCRELVASGRCNRWISIELNVGKETKLVSDCTDNWGPTLMSSIANGLANGLAGVQKATENFRNEVLRMNGALPPLDQHVIEADNKQEN